MDRNYSILAGKYPTEAVRLRIVLVLFLMISYLDGLLSECPRLCECKWKSGKESVLCLNANLSNIPGRLDGGTQVLDLTGNNIVQIGHDAFADANLLNLQRIFLSRCRLKVIEKYAFRKLNNLVELDLSSNQLTMIPVHTFDSIPELREIKLNSNPIFKIVNEAFNRVPQLVRLELSDCKIVSIEPRAFLGLESSLEWLKLDGNKMIEIKSEILTSFHNLHDLELARNPWNCSCNLRPLRAWMLREKIPYSVPPLCKFPQRLNGKSWDKIDLDDFACTPKILAADDPKAYAIESRNATLTCVIEGVPQPFVRWSVKNKMIANLSIDMTMPVTHGRKMYMVSFERGLCNLTIVNVEMQDAGIYVCAAENRAGQVEATIALTVSRRPPEAPLGAKILLICILIAILLVIGSSFAALCFCSFRKKRKLPHWNAPARSDSYEKIEMNRKCNMRQFRNEENGYIRSRGSGGCATSFGGAPSSGGGGGGGAASGCTNTAFGGFSENGGIAIVNPTKKNGDYRNIPTDDEGTDGYCDDNNEAINGSFVIQNRRDNSSYKWKSGIGVTSPIVDRHNSICEETDLHIPRLIDVSSNPDSGSSSISSQVKIASSRVNNTASSSGYAQPKVSWSNQLLSKKLQSIVATSASSAAAFVSSATTSIASTSADSQNHMQTSYVGNDPKGRFCPPSTVESEFGDSDMKYPDLIDVSIFGGSSLNGSCSSANVFCTLPRKASKYANKYFKNTSDSQSPLLPESANKFGSGTDSFIGECSFSGDITNRRLSAESQPYSSISQYGINMRNLVNSQRSSSFLNLVSSSTMNNHRHRNPSLPSSPVREGPKSLSSTATPLLDFSSLTNRSTGGTLSCGNSNIGVGITNNPITSTAMNSANTNNIIPPSNAYDYHAAQLERFLEEYRNLQEQLCKMKETCESIRKKEAPLREALGHSAQYADPVMFNAAISGSQNLVVDHQNPKTILKSKTILPGQPPDPPPYWLHRNAMLKRFNDQSPSDFFQS